jgi:tetratricopeptide (TPR) repeat protein
MGPWPGAHAALFSSANVEGYPMASDLAGDRPRHVGSPSAGKDRGKLLVLAVSALIPIAASAAFLLAWRLRPDPLADGWKALDDGRAYEAYRTAIRRLEGAPDDPSGLLLAARSLSRLGKYPQAEAYYERIKSLDVDDMHARALGLTQLNRPQDAADLYEEILKRRPADVTALTRLAAVRIGQGRWKDALRPAEALAAIPDQVVPGLALLGFIHHHAKDAQQAVDAFEAVLERDPELKAVSYPARVYWDHFALDLMALGRAQEAREHLEKVIERDPDAGLIEILGTAYYQDGDRERAVRCWDRAVAADPSLSDAWLGLGRDALATGRPEDALKPLLRAAELSPDAYEPRYALSQAYERLGRAAEASAHRKAADERRRRTDRTAAREGER